MLSICSIFYILYIYILYKYLCIYSLPNNFNPTEFCFRQTPTSQRVVEAAFDESLDPQNLKVPVIEMPYGLRRWGNKLKSPPLGCFFRGKKNNSQELNGYNSHLGCFRDFFFRWLRTKCYRSSFCFNGDSQYNHYKDP